MAAYSSPWWSRTDLCPWRNQERFWSADSCVQGAGFRARVRHPALANLSAREAGLRALRVTAPGGAALRPDMMERSGLTASLQGCQRRPFAGRQPQAGPARRAPEHGALLRQSDGGRHPHRLAAQVYLRGPGPVRNGPRARPPRTRPCPPAREKAHDTAAAPAGARLGRFCGEETGIGGFRAK